MDRGMVRHARNAVERVEVLVQRDLEHRRAALAKNPPNRVSTCLLQKPGRSARRREKEKGDVPRGDDAVREEEDPHAVPPLAVLRDHLILVRHPVEVPAVDRRGVVHAEHVDVLHLEACSLELVDHPPQRARCVRTREDVLVHEETPVFFFKKKVSTW